MRACLLSFILLLPSPCLAALDCASAVATPDLNACEAQALDRVEQELNSVYRELLARLATDALDEPAARDARAKLIEAQRLWVRFREADCEAVFTLHQGGTIRTLMQLGCMRSHAEQRVEALRSFLL